MNKQNLKNATYQDMSKYKIAILGDTGVGKSNFVIRFIENVFIDEFDPTIENYYRKQFLFNNEPCFLDIFDTANYHEFTLLTDYLIRVSEGFIITYDITSTASFEACDEYIEKILRLEYRDEVRMILIGTKSDLEDQRTVPFKVGAKKAKVHGIPFLETSAKLNDNVEKVFYELVKLIRNMKLLSDKTQIKKTGKCQLL